MYYTLVIAEQTANTVYASTFNVHGTLTSC